MPSFFYSQERSWPRAIKQQDYDNDLMLDTMTYRDFLSRCDSDTPFYIGEINFITFKNSGGRFACTYDTVA